MSSNGKGIEWPVSLPTRRALARRELWRMIDQLLAGLRTDDVLLIVEGAARELAAREDRERGARERAKLEEAERERDERLEEIAGEGGIHL